MSFWAISKQCCSVPRGTREVKVSALHCAAWHTWAHWYLKTSSASWLRHLQSTDFENLNFVLRYSSTAVREELKHRYLDLLRTFNNPRRCLPESCTAYVVFKVLHCPEEAKIFFEDWAEVIRSWISIAAEEFGAQLPLINSCIQKSTSSHLILNFDSVNKRYC